MLLFMDGVAHYDTSRIGVKYSAVNTDSATWAVTAEGRFGNCVKRVATSSTVTTIGYLSIAPLMTRLGPWTPTSSGVVGFAVKVDDLGKVQAVGVGNNGIVCVMEGSGYHVKLSLNSDGTFSLLVNDGTGDALLAQSTEGLQSSSWSYLECKWVIHATTGSVVVRVNGVTVLDYSGNTRRYGVVGPGLGVWNAVRLLAIASSASSAPFATARHCDLYLADLAASDGDDVSDFLGDGVIDTIMPNGPGASTGWAASSGANWDTTNDLPAPDDDGSYVSAATPGLQDTYNFQDIPAGAEVKGVHVNLLARKETEGSSAIAPVVRQGSTDYVGPTQGVASTSYDRYLTQPYDLNPATMAKFTAAEINAGQFGVKKIT